MYNKELSEYEDAMREYNASHPENINSPTAHNHVDDRVPESSNTHAREAAKAAAA